MVFIMAGLVGCASRTADYSMPVDPPEAFSAGGTGNIPEQWQQGFLQHFTKFVDRRYQPFLGACLRNRYMTLSSAVTLLVVMEAYGYSDHMGMIMIPGLDR